MKKRRLILGDYDTAEDGLFTLSACKITKGSQVQSFVSVPGRYAPIDTSTLLTDGQPYYGSAALEATLESSEGTRDERLARVSGMVNALDGRSMRIIHPDHPERYLVGRVQVRPEYNDPAHCAVRVSAVCEPWLYNAQETEVQANLPHAEIHKIGGVTRKCTNLLDPAVVVARNNTTISNGTITQKEADTNNASYFKCQTYNNSTLVTSALTEKTVTATGRYGVAFEKTEQTNLLVFGLNGTQRDTTAEVNISDLPNGTYFISVDFTNVTQGSISWKDMMLNEGSTALPYEPYFEGLRSAPVSEVESVGANLAQVNTLPIPEAVQALDGYGDGVNESVYNYIDFEKKQFVKRVGKKVLDGTEAFYDTATYVYTPILAECKPNGEMLCDRYDTADGEILDKMCFIGGAGIAFRDDSHKGASAFKAYAAEQYASGTPITFYYELATPVVTDISDLLPADNIIGVEGGTLTMVNPYGYEVPQEVTYYLDGESPQQVELTNAGRLAVVPVVTVKGEVTLSYGNTTQTLSTGTYTLPWLYLTPDKGPLLPASHIVTCSGGGSVTFTYREAVLAE